MYSYLNLWQAYRSLCFCSRTVETEWSTPSCAVSGLGESWPWSNTAQRSSLLMERLWENKRIASCYFFLSRLWDTHNHLSRGFVCLSFDSLGLDSLLIPSPLCCRLLCVNYLTSRPLMFRNTLGLLDRHPQHKVTPFIFSFIFSMKEHVTLP